MKQNNLTYFGKRESTLLAGVAVVFMMIHHLFGFDRWLSEGVEWCTILPVGDLPVECIVARSGQFCVHVFAFMSGFVIWKRSGDYSDRRLRFSRLIKFLICYWIVCVLFWLYAIAIGDTLPPLTKTIQNLFGLSSGADRPYVNVSFAWYVSYYICLVMVSPLLLKIFSKGIVCDVMAFIAIGLLLHYVKGIPMVLNSLNQLKSYIWPLLFSAVGLITAKYSLFERFKNIIGRTLPLPVSIVGIVLVVLCRYNLLKFSISTGGGIESALVILFVYFFVELFNGIRSERLEKIVMFVGTYSMNIWFIHSIFFTGSRPLQPLLYAPKYSILILAFALVMCVPVAWIVGCVQNYVLSFFRADK